MKTVKITANPKTNQVFTQSTNADGSAKLDKNGKEHGFIRVEARTLNLGFGYKKAVKSRSTLIAMTKESFIESADLMFNGAVVPGVIVRQDSTTPFFDGQKPLQAPKKDAKGEVIEGEFNIITSGGLPVYRNEYFSENQNAEDTKLESYDKIEEVVSQEAAGTILAK